MKLQKHNRATVADDLPSQSCGVHFFARTFGQIISMSLEYAESSMSLPFSLRKVAVCFCWGLLLVLPLAASSQTNYYGANGTEYSIIGSLPSDQVWPDLSLGSSGGFLVWQDNITDGSGWGISARRLDNTLSGTL